MREPQEALEIAICSCEREARWSASGAEACGLGALRIPSRSDQKLEKSRMPLEANGLASSLLGNHRGIRRLAFNVLRSNSGPLGNRLMSVATPGEVKDEGPGKRGSDSRPPITR